MSKTKEVLTFWINARRRGRIDCRRVEGFAKNRAGHQSWSRRRRIDIIAGEPCRLESACVEAGVEGWKLKMNGIEKEEMKNLVRS